MNVNFYGQNWDIRLYKPGENLSFIENEDRVGMDTEFEVREENYGPINTVVMSVAWPDSGICHVVWYEDIQEYIEQVRQKNYWLVWRLYSGGQDLLAVDFHNNHLWDLFWHPGYYMEDMELRMALYEIASGTFVNTLGLSKRTKTYLKEDLEGKSHKDDPDPIQMSYFQDMTLTEPHIRYAGKDAIATVKLGDVTPRQPNERIKVQGAYSLHMMGERGYPVDREKMREKRKEFVDKAWDYFTFLADWGKWPGKNSSFLNSEDVNKPELGMSGGEKELERILLALEKSYGIEFDRTPKGSISMDQDSPYKPFYRNNLTPHPIIVNNKKFKYCEHMLSSFLNWRMVRSDDRVHPYYDPIKTNGRTSAKEPAIQTNPQEGGIREIYTAPPGYKILIIDIKQGELCTLAQSCYDRFGFSRMGDLINAGEDLHTNYATSFIIPAVGKNPEDLTEKEFSYYRKCAKPCNFGFPGGFGIYSFMSFARNSYGIEFSWDFAQESKSAWKEEYPEMKQHLQPVPDNEHWLQTLKKALKEETDSNIAFQLQDFNDARRFMQSTLDWSEEDIDDLIHRTSKYIVKTYDGPNNDVCIRRNASYTAACNYYFSRPMADAMSYCMAEFEPLGIHPVCFVHDEFHFFVRNDRDMQKNVNWLQEVTRQKTQDMIPDVTITIEPMLTSRWYKEAEPEWDSKGNLLEWDPSMKKKS